jgi:hypothetical protein
VLATIQAGQRHRDVVIATTLLRWRLAQPIVTAREPSHRQVNLKKY